MTQRERVGNPADVLDQALDMRQARIHTATVGIVKAVDLEKQTVTVKVALQGFTVDEQGEKHWQDIPLLVDVPIVWPRAGGFALTFPVKPEDECLVVFGERCFDAWWQSGGVQKPIDYRMHDLSDAFAVFGVTSQPRKLPDVKDNAVELRTDDRSNWISLRKGSLDIHIEGPTTVYTKTLHQLTCENLTANVTKAATVNCDTATIAAKTSITGDSPTITLTGDTTVQKTLTVMGAFAAMSGMTCNGGSGGATATFNGSIHATGDVTAGDISLQNHVHTEQGDGADTSTPH